MTEYRHYKKDPLFIAGLIIYINQNGRKEDSVIRITGASPEVHRIFIKFAYEYLGVPRERIRFWLLLYPKHTPLTCSRFWSKALKVPISQFHKYQVVEGKNIKNSLHFGIGNTIIGSTVLKRKLLKWSEIALKEL